MAEVNIPAGPLNEAPWGAIHINRSVERAADARREAIRAALDGVELGAYDERIVDWLAGWDLEAVTVCSWLLRVRAAAVEGRIVLDEPAELGLAWHDGEDALVLRSDGIVMFPRGADEFVMDSAKAREWAAQLAAMADARDAETGGEGPVTSLNHPCACPDDQDWHDTTCPEYTACDRDRDGACGGCDWCICGQATYYASLAEAERREQAQAGDAR